jgi:hypothetical protein
LVRRAANDPQQTLALLSRSLSVSHEETDMNQTRLRDWLEIVGIFSVVAGLILVAFQINQSSFLVRAELGSNAYDRMVSVDQTFIDANFAEVWAKSYEQPEDLTFAEMIQLEGYLTSLLDYLESEKWLYDLDIYEGSIDLLIPYFVGPIIGNRFATAWWAETKSIFDRDLADKIDQQIANSSVNFDIERYQRIRSRL